MRIIKTPLVLFTFNRSDNLRSQLNAIKEFYFEKVYFVSDGPRNHFDEQGVMECRELIRNKSNYGELIAIENQENWGCKRNFLTHLKTIFDEEDRIIVLEDDCIPIPAFFEFCEWALDFYENNLSVRLVSGSNLLDYAFDESAKCGFSQYINIWGWAGWRDKTWDVINPYLSITSIKSLNNPVLKFNELNFLERIYWKNIFKHSVYSHKIWDFYLQFGFFLTNSLSVYPAKNLIANIGFGDNATHTRGRPEYVDRSMPSGNNEIILILEPPDSFQISKTRDKMVLKKLWGYSKFKLLKLYLMNILRYVVS